ncbi:hypothetical protein QBC33DRAFT_579393 [Phialemonium atrogriseum]|uniref:Aminoglycoside phosphotransferase domain-containing protein n=1 Tax=Phialemonium atrogriseum TaxID=1093897 RepID=A0AAJ0FFM5_9PEZI|nr:uncharacterized protein QBC33DRAFT_579393 [Phialemonium atrogriseum]KAK1765657.1 hypothetical protein QBC33DRAFT_579393 [Phialemonium atrogriseum]
MDTGNNPDPIDAFFHRHGLTPSARAQCHAFARAHLGGARDIREATTQGYCSYTLLCDGDDDDDEDAIVQFRPAAHQLDIELAAAARRIYGALAPATRFLGVVPGDRRCPLYAYSMARIPGVSLAEFRAAAAAADPPTGRSSSSPSPHRRQRQRQRHRWQENLVRGFARFLCAGWRSSLDSHPPASAAAARGRVGGSLRRRLEMMRDGLPARFRPAVEDVLSGLDAVEALPWVLTHGDVVPGNIMVEGPADEEGEERDTAAASRRRRPGSLCGLLDWAEAEFLPFGVGLAGAEELLGEALLAAGAGVGADGPYPPPSSRFAYYPCAAELRSVLWEELRAGIPELPLLAGDAVARARVLGILLWHGIAFADGRLDRVVQEGRDDEEIQRLDVFLFGAAAGAEIRPGLGLVIVTGVSEAGFI